MSKTGRNWKRACLQLAVDSESDSSSPDAKKSEKKTITTAHLPPNKKPKVFLARSQAWNSSTSVLSEKSSSKHLVKKSKPEFPTHVVEPVNRGQSNIWTRY